MASKKGKEVALEAPQKQEPSIKMDNKEIPKVETTERKGIKYTKLPSGLTIAENV